MSNDYIKNIGNFIPLTLSVVIDHSNWQQFVEGAIDELEEKIQLKYNTSELFLGHDMGDPNQLYIFLYAPNAKKFYVARYIDQFLKDYLSRQNFPIIGKQRMDESLWMPYSENTVKYGLFSICDFSENDIVPIYSTLRRINREIMNDSTFSYDILLLRSFALTYLTAVHFEKYSPLVNVNEFLELLFNGESEPFEQFYKDEKELFLSVVENLDKYGSITDMEWLHHWNVFLETIVPLKQEKFTPKEAKEKFFEIISVVNGTNRLPTVERIALVVAIRLALRDYKSLGYHFQESLSI